MQVSPVPQTIPQPPQFAASVSVFVSQPLAVPPVQSAKPGVQLVITHAPLEQVAAVTRDSVVQFVVVPHVVPQVVGAFRFVSQPSARPPEQFANPVSQLPSAHVPVMQDSVAFGMSQGVPHVPQSVSVRVEVSQPVAGFPSQLPKPVVHAPSVQVPPGQVSAAFARLQATMQLPQLVSESSRASQPLAGLPSQLPKPLEQVPSAHASVAQLSAAFARSQDIPQAPQFASESSVFSQPLFGLPSQLP